MMTKSIKTECNKEIYNNSKMLSKLSIITTRVQFIFECDILICYTFTIYTYILI